MGQRQAERSRHRHSRSHARHDIDRNILRQQALDFLARPAENHRIARSQPDHASASLRSFTIMSLTSCCLQLGRPARFPTRIRFASRRARSSTSSETRSSNRMTSAACSAASP